MAGNINITNNIMDDAKPILKNFRVVKGYAGKKSISALSKDLIMQFPVLMSGGIDIDDACAIAKALEKMFATMFLAVWSADAQMDMKEYGMNGVRDFVKRYHNNDDIPDVITYTGDILSLTDTLMGNEHTVSISASDETMSPEDTAKLWENVEDSLSLESLNEMYLPALRSQKHIAMLTAALEGKKDKDKDDTKSKKDDDDNEDTSSKKGKDDDDDSGDFFDSVSSFGTKIAQRSIDPYSGKVGSDSKSSKWSYTPPGARISKPSEMGASFSAQEIKMRDKLTSLEPTMIDVTFLVHGSGAGGIGYEEVPERDSKGKKTGKKKTVPVSINVSARRALVGVKTMIRIVNSNQMIPNVIASIQDQSLAFKFIKYTKGEMKIGRDMLLGISRIKQDAGATNQADIWFAALRKRKRSAKTFRFSETGINPFATLVLTTDEVEQIKAASGYDVMNKTTTKLLMDNLFLLGLVIVNTNTGIVHTIFDGNEYYATTNMKALKAQMNKGADDLDTLREMRKLMGRV